MGFIINPYLVQPSGTSIVTDGLVLNLDAGNSASYPGSGTTWTDLSGQGNNGTLINGVGYSSSNGGTLLFDGVNDYVNVNNGANILSKTSYTKSIWFYTTTFSTFNNLISGDLNSKTVLWLGGTNTLSAGHDDVYNRVVSTTSLSLNTWYYGVVTFDNTNGWNLYLNGVKESTNSSTISFAGNQNVYVGAFGTQYTFSGNIPSVQIYNRALTEAEITQNFNALKSRYGL